MRWARRVGDLTVCSELANPGVRGELTTATFSWSESRRLLTHRLPACEIDNDLGDRIAAELVRPGHVRDFEAAFAGVVTSSDGDPLRAWARFYARTLDGLRASRSGAGSAGGTGAIATFGAIYGHALGLVAGESLLDAGSCFGFSCLLAAERGLSVTGTDVSAPTVALAERMAVRLSRRVERSQTPGLKSSHAAVAPPRRARFAVADVRVGLPARADTVTALHVLEHLEPAEIPAALACLCAAARRRVIVAVPLERSPDPTYGHRTAFGDLEALGGAAAGVGGGWRAELHEHRGGWLVLDRVRHRSDAPGRCGV